MGPADDARGRCGLQRASGSGNSIGMVELFVALAVVLILLGVALGSALVGIGWLFGLGTAAALIGLVSGAAVGVVYHAALYRTLGRRGRLPEGWYWRPTSFHRELEPEERRLVMPWFYAGALGVGVALGGCVLLLVGLTLL